MTEGRKVALLVIHGMGQQRPHSLTDSFVRGLHRSFDGKGMTPELEHIREPVSDDRRSVKSSVRLKIPERPDDAQGVGSNAVGTLDVHEVYWADTVTGTAKLWAVIKWIAVTSLVPLKGWAANGLIFAPIATGSRRTLLFLREIWRSLWVPLIGVGLILLFGYAASNTEKLEEVRDELKLLFDQIDNPVAALAAFLILVAGVSVLVGALRLGSLKVTQRNPGPADAWRRASLVAGGAMVGASVAVTLGWGVPVGAILAQVWDVVLSLGAVWAGLALIVTAVAGGLLVNSMGDVMIYAAGANELSPYSDARGKILDITVDRLSDLLALPKEGAALGDPEYDAVYVAAHSLGSVVAYDTINRIAVERDALGGKLPTLEGEAKDIVATKLFDGLHGFLSFGSPLDKIYYFFRRTIGPRRAVQAQIISSLVQFRKRPSGRKYDPFAFAPYETREPPAFAWWNAWAKTDPLGHKLDFYNVDEQPRMKFSLFRGHTGFWTSDAFYDTAVAWLTQPTFLELSENVAVGGTIELAGAGLTRGTPNQGAPVEVAFTRAGETVPAAAVAAEADVDGNLTYKALQLPAEVEPGLWDVRLVDRTTGSRSKTRAMTVA